MYGRWEVNTIKISETKIKVILSADDMTAHHIDGGVDYSDPRVREALRGLLREAGRDVGFDIDNRRSFIQLYPDRSGGCELFLTLLDIAPKSSPESEEADTGAYVGQTYADTETEGEMPIKGATSPTGTARYKYSINIYEFFELSPMLLVCRRLRERGEGGESAAYAEADGSYFLVVYEAGRSTPIDSVEMICGEYGGVRRKNSAYAYIKEHCKPICDRGAVERLGVLA